MLDLLYDFPGGSDGKASAYNAGDPGSIPGLGGSSGEGNGNPLQYSCLENPMDRGAWWATVHGVAKGLLCCAGFSLQWLLLLWSAGCRPAGSVVALPGVYLEHRLNSSDIGA